MFINALLQPWVYQTVALAEHEYKPSGMDPHLRRFYQRARSFFPKLTKSVLKKQNKREMISDLTLLTNIILALPTEQNINLVIPLQFETDCPDQIKYLTDLHL